MSHLARGERVGNIYIYIYIYILLLGIRGSAEKFID